MLFILTLKLFTKQDWHLPMYLGRLEYIAVNWSIFCTSVHGYAVHFIVHLSTLGDQLGG